MRLTASLLRRIGRTRFKYWQRYVERERDEPSIRTIKNPFVGVRYQRQKRFLYEEERPWTTSFKQINTPGQYIKDVLVEPVEDWNLFVGDRVEVLIGKDAGKIGLINSIIHERNWVYVEGLNPGYKMQSPSKNAMPLCIASEKPLLYNQVRLVDPADDKACDAEWRYTEEGEEVRVSTRSGRIIPLPNSARMLEDFIVPANYLDNDLKDTKEKELTKVTFKPVLSTFADDINEQMGIKEDRKPAKTYWW